MQYSWLICSMVLDSSLSGVPGSGIDMDVCQMHPEEAVSAHVPSTAQPVLRSPASLTGGRWPVVASVQCALRAVMSLLPALGVGGR